MGMYIDPARGETMHAKQYTIDLSINRDGCLSGLLSPPLFSAHTFVHDLSMNIRLMG